MILGFEENGGNRSFLNVPVLGLSIYQSPRKIVIIGAEKRPLLVMFNSSRATILRDWKAIKRGPEQF
jgi:hypothetical protein